MLFGQIGGVFGAKSGEHFRDGVGVADRMI